MELHTILPDAVSFACSVGDVDLGEEGYSLSVSDEANKFIQQMKKRAKPEAISPNPVNGYERELALMITWEEVLAHPPAYGDAKACDVCGFELTENGLYVDGRLRGEAMWVNMCASCARNHGEGIGWGSGQLYARQPNGTFRLVSGFRPELPEQDKD